MIISKPKVSTLFSLSIFLILAYGLSVYLLLRVLGSSNPSFWITIGMGVSVGVALAVTFKVITGYKELHVSKNRIDVYAIFSLFKRRYYFKELLSWEETVIKTATGYFKELTLKFKAGRKVKLTLQENSNYEKVKAFMHRNFSRKRQKQ